MKTIDERTPQEKILEALTDLTKPRRVVEWQGQHEHTWQKCAGHHGLHRCATLDCELLVCEWCDATKGPKGAHTEPAVHGRTDPPLLDWLQESIGSNTGGSGGGKQARERTPIDVGAFTLYEDIDGRIRSWMSELGGKVGKSLTATQILSTWYTLWQGTNPSDGLIEAYANIMEGWADAIRDILDPPKRIEITSACPFCGQEWINVGLKRADGTDDPDDTERVRVLVAVERENMQDSYATCRACDRVWKGTGMMRHLRIAMDDAEAAKVEGLTA